MNAVIELVDNFESWRNSARRHLIAKTPPADLVWQPANDGQQFLFGTEPPPAPPPTETIRLPKAFVESAKIVARHRDPNRWSLLYRVAWRIQNENPHLMHLDIDDDIRALAHMRKAVEHDQYKMRAFVRFRRVMHEGNEQYVAWYRPDHYTLDSNECFFVDRFGGIRWAILTPDTSMIWDLKQIAYGPGVLASQAPAEDEFEELWRTYYKSIYNPARLNLDAMRAQLPVRRWQDLPESRAIPELVRISRGRVHDMAAAHPSAASKFIPQDADLAALRQAVRQCNACELCGLATQPVFGEGNPYSRIVLVGEQPGDEEDRQGRPFVGPAGAILDTAMRDASIERGDIYLTNAVKAFRYEERGKRRIHQTPRPSHVATCRPWLEAELAAIRPDTIVCLGATAAHSVLGRTVKIGAERGRAIPHPTGAQVLVTYHPSAILRAPDETTQAQLLQSLTRDLSAAVAPSLEPPTPEPQAPSSDPQNR